jgi:hypothetical protein
MKRTALAAALAIAAAGCGGGDSPSTLSTAPTPTVTTENFAGTVAVGGNDVHAFTVAFSGGQVNAILTAAGPPSTIYMGLGIGTPSGSACTLLTNGSVVTPAGTVAQLTGTLDAGSYCVMVYDAGNQTTPVTYAVTVNHY